MFAALQPSASNATKFGASLAANRRTLKAKRKDLAYGDVWTWVAMDADTKLAISYLVGGRDSGYAMALMDDLRRRVTTRLQLTTDGHSPYLNAVEEAFGSDIDYAMLIKLYGQHQIPDSPVRP
jgi:transposase-like protein